MARKKKMVATP